VFELFIDRKSMNDEEVDEHEDDLACVVPVEVSELVELLDEFPPFNACSLRVVGEREPDVSSASLSDSGDEHEGEIEL
jgi:hypothetical protein